MYLSTLKVVPLGGLGEIGMNCLVLEADDEMIVIDCGLLFSDLEHFGVEFVIPDFTYLLDRKDKLKAFVITHGHEDHIGALPFVARLGLDAPVYATPFTAALIRDRLRREGISDQLEIREVAPDSSFGTQRFRIRSISVNHSIIDAVALVIDTPVGRIVHTGDFKIDPSPYFGETTRLERFRAVGDEGVLLLLSDSTNVERTSHSLSEKDIYRAFERIFAAAEGMVVVSMFASNIARMAQVFDLAKKLGKRIAVTGRTMETNSQLGVDHGCIQGADKVLVSLDDLAKYPKNQVIVLATGSQGEFRSALARMAHGEHRSVKLGEGDLVIMSSKFIPGNERAIGRIINQLFKQGSRVVYEAVEEIHTSGHATRPELKQMIEAVRPRFFIPVHGEYRHLVLHSDLAKETGLDEDRVLVATNGAVIELTPESCRIVEQMEEGKVLVEGREGNDISKIILKERRQLGEKGVVFSLMVRDAETLRIVAGPEIITRGLAPEDRELDLLKGARRIVKNVAREYEKSIAEGYTKDDLQETVRIELRRYFNEALGKKPTVLPIVLDV